MLYATFEMKLNKYLSELKGKRWLSKFILTAILILISECLIVKLFGLSLMGLSVILFVTILLSPSFVRVYYKQKKEEKRFSDLTDYMEQMISSYRENGNIARALKDCEDTFEVGSTMKKLLQKAIHVRVTGEGVEDISITRESLRVIEKEFPSRRLKLLHDFLTKAEETGGNHTTTLNVLLEDLQAWRGRTAVYQRKRQKIKMECLISTLLATIFSSLPNMLLKFSGLDINVSEETLYQVSATVALVFFLLIANRIMKKSSNTWLDEKDNNKKHEKVMETRYHFIVNYTKEKAIRDAIFPLVIGFLVTTISIVLGLVIGGGFRVFCIALGCSIFTFFLYQMIQRKKIFIKKVKKSVEQEFPYWLLSVTLLLQTESVFQAIMISKEESTGVLRKELEHLAEGIYHNPTSLVPYKEFFQDFEMVSIKQAMRILYSIQNTGVSGMEQTLYNLTKQNNELMDVSEKITFENRLAGMSAMRFLPQLVACMHMLLNLGLTMLLVFGMFSAIA